MPQSISKKAVNINKDTGERFNYIYPKLSNLFAERAFFLALQDKKYFEEIFLNPLFIEVK